MKFEEFRRDYECSNAAKGSISFFNFCSLFCLNIIIRPNILLRQLSAIFKKLKKQTTRQEAATRAIKKCYLLKSISLEEGKTNIKRQNSIWFL